MLARSVLGALWGGCAVPAAEHGVPEEEIELDAGLALPARPDARASAPVPDMATPPDASGSRDAAGQGGATAHRTRRPSTQPEWRWAATRTRPSSHATPSPASSRRTNSTALDRAFNLTEGPLWVGQMFVALDDYADGLAVDDDGNLYAAVRRASRIDVFAPSGRRLGSIRFPRLPANMSFGEADRRTLYVTAGESIYSVRVNVPGLALHGVDGIPAGARPCAARAPLGGPRVPRALTFCPRR